MAPVSPDHGGGVSLGLVTSVLIGDPQRRRDPMGRRGEPCGDREIGVTQPQAKECLKLPEAQRSKDRFFRELLEEAESF